MNKIARIITGVVVFVLVACCAYRWFGKDLSEDGTIKIGAILPLSTKGANLGENSRQAIELALKEANKTNPRLEVIYGDDKCDPKEAVSVYQSLRPQGVRIVVGPICSPSALAVAPLAEKDGVVLITPAAAAEAVTKAGDYIFRNNATVGQKYERLSEFAVSNFNSLATIYDQSNDAYVVGNKILVDKFHKQNKEVSEEKFSKDETDFRAQLAKIKSRKPEIIFIGSLMPQGGMIVNQMKELGISSQIIADDGFTTDSKFVEMTGEHSEGIIFVTPDFDRDTNREFWDSYVKQSGKNPDVFAVQTYDIVMVLKKVMQESCASKDDPVCIKNSLYNLQDYIGAGGRIVFDENGDVKKQVVLKQIINGQLVGYRD